MHTTQFLIYLNFYRNVHIATLFSIAFPNNGMVFSKSDVPSNESLSAYLRLKTGKQIKLNHVWTLYSQDNKRSPHIKMCAFFYRFSTTSIFRIFLNSNHGIYHMVAIIYWCKIISHSNDISSIWDVLY